MEFLQNIGLFFLQTLIIVAGIIAILLTLASIALKNKMAKHVEVENLNEKQEDLQLTLQETLLSSEDFKKIKKEHKKKDKEKNKNSEAQQPKTFYLEFLKGDVQASQVQQFKDEINAVLLIAQKNDDVVINVESPGGIVHGYGLAAAQILRLREAGLKVTVCVDKVAASGGYLMACVAHEIVASPFAIIGSIGVVAQVPNFNKLLKKHEIDYKEYTAGDFKRTVSVFGEITPKGEQKFIEQLESTHLLFKSFVGRFRPQLDLSAVATGEYWFGQDALQLKLVDRLLTSDDLILEKMKSSQVIKISFEKKQTLSEKISQMISMTLQQTLRKSLNTLQNHGVE